MRSRSGFLLLAGAAMAALLRPAAALSILSPETAAKYAAELMGLALIAIYLISAYFGDKKNREVATNWIRCVLVTKQHVMHHQQQQHQLKCNSM
jgi:hypothetical protein